jgi:hypothetical protein
VDQDLYEIDYLDLLMGVPSSPGTISVDICECEGINSPLVSVDSSAKGYRIAFYENIYFKKSAFYSL